MKFNVLNDGTILNANGMQVGTITISSDKYKDDIISAIESPLPAHIIDDIRIYCPNTDSTDRTVIQSKIQNKTKVQIMEDYIEIISIVNEFID